MNDPSYALPSLDAVRARARTAANHARTPYSGHAVGAALLLSDGQWVPGVRVESASYPLTISALLGAFVAAVAGGRTDVRAAALTRDFYPGEVAWLSTALGSPVTAEAPDGAAFGAAPLPEAGSRWEPFTDAAPTTEAAGIRLARQAAERALVPESDFRVGCALVTASGRVVLGCNVEFGEWTRGLCAERTALAAAAAYDVGAVERIYLSCPTDPQGTPCGACRQLLAEQASDASIVMDRGDAPPEATTTADLLPNFFTGASLRL
jgi:homotetrameric cytidine deaminase